MRGWVTGMAFVVLLPFLPSLAATQPHYTQHAPISIGSDLDFLNPKNGVTGGSGTVEDPYIISGWDIDAAGEDGGGFSIPNLLGAATAIDVHDVSAFFVVRDCRLHGGGHNPTTTTTGIRIEGATHLQSLSDLVIEDVTVGIWLHGAPMAYLHGLHLTGPGIVPADASGAVVATKGILIHDVHADNSGVAIRDSELRGWFDGVEAWGVRDVSLHGLDIRDSQQAGLMFVSLERVPTNVRADNITVAEARFGVAGSLRESQLSGLHLHDLEVGVWLQEGANVSVQSSRFDGMARAGFEGTDVRGLVFRQNHITGSGLWAFRLGDGVGGIIEDNDMTLNGPSDSGGRGPTVDIYRQTGVVIRRNHIHNNTSAGIELGYGAHNTTVEGNRILDNGGNASSRSDAGINLMSNHNLVRFNWVNRNSGPGLALWDVEGNVVQDNDLSGNHGPDVVWERKVDSRNQVGPNEGVPAERGGSGRSSPGPEAVDLLAILTLLAARRRRGPKAAGALPVCIHEPAALA